MGYIITGGAGFIGSHIVEEAIARKEKVTVIDNLSTGNLEKIKPFMKQIRFVKGDILDLQLLKKEINENDIIFHQAALSSVSRSIQNPIATNRANIEGTLNVLIASRDKKARKVIFASSSSVYGDSIKLPKEETMQPSPKSPYALSKLTCEYYCSLFTSLYGLKTVCLRYFNVFGPRQDPDSEYSAVIPKFIRLLKNNKQPMIYGDGKQSRDFTYVKNVVDANFLASEKEVTGIFNVACGKRYTLIELVDLLNKILAKNIKPQISNERAGDVKHSLADITKAEKSFGYLPKITFEEGLKLTAREII
jgi:nucleoside-diphosphate-sugar epimerase